MNNHPHWSSNPFVALSGPERVFLWLRTRALQLSVTLEQLLLKVGIHNSLGNTWSESTQSSQNLCYTKRILKVFTLEIHKITLHLGPHAHVRESTQLPRQHLCTTAQGTPDLYAKVYLNPEYNKNNFNFFTLSDLARNILLLWVPVFIFAFFFVHESLFLLLRLWYCSLFIKTHWLKERQKHQY